jgi:hypothetical protein
MFIKKKELNKLKSKVKNLEKITDYADEDMMSLFDDIDQLKDMMCVVIRKQQEMENQLSKRIYKKKEKK